MSLFFWLYTGIKEVRYDSESKTIFWLLNIIQRLKFLVVFWFHQYYCVFALQANMWKLKKWLCVRLVFLTFLIMVTIYKLSTHKYFAFDGCFEILKLYSIYEICAVKSYIDVHQIDTPILLKDRI